MRNATHCLLGFMDVKKSTQCLSDFHEPLGDECHALNPMDPEFILGHGHDLGAGLVQGFGTHVSRASLHGMHKFLECMKVVF